jgi:hypothetical protein
MTCLGRVLAFDSSAEDVYGDSQIISVSEKLKTMKTMEMPRQILPGSRTCHQRIGGYPAFADTGPAFDELPSNFKEELPKNDYHPSFNLVLSRGGVKGGVAKARVESLSHRECKYAGGVVY